MPQAQEVVSCDGIKEPESPFIVEWSAAKRGDLESMSGEGVVVVRYDGCKKLKVLTECSARGNYRFKAFTSPRLDSVTMKTRQDLYAALPIGAANIEASLGDGGTVDLRYVLVGTKRSSTRPGPRDLNGRCAGATHYVSSMSMGAFSLERTSQRQLASEGNVALMGGVGAQSRDQRTQLRRDGDVDECSQTRSCRSAVRVTLAPLSQAEAGLAAPAGSPIDAASGSRVRTLGTTQSDAVHRGGTLRIGLPTRMASHFNFESRLGNMNYQVKRAVLQALVSFDQRGDTKLKLLDERVVSKDGRTIRLTLKKGLKFHPHRCVPGGREATAKDLLYSIETFRSLGRLDVEFAPGKPVVLEDRYTVELSLVKRDVYLDQSLTNVFLLPHELEGCADLKKITQLVGTGPFKMTSISPTGYARLERHPDYWERDEAGRQLPYVDAVEYLTVESVTEALTQLYDGKLHLYFGMRSHLGTYFTDAQVLRPAFKDKAAQEALGVGLGRTGGRHARFLGFFPVGIKGPLGDKRVRRAVSLAIDRDAVARALHTKSVAAGRILDESLLGFDPRFEGHVLDRDKARSLLAKAGYPGGKGLKTMVIGSHKVYRSAADVFAQNLQQVGIPVRIVSVVQNQAAQIVRDGEVDALVGDFGYDFTSDEAPGLLDMLRLRDLKATPNGGLQNLDTPRVREIMSTLSSIPKREERRRAFSDLERAIIEEARPFVPMARMSMEHGLVVVLYNRKFSSWFNPLTGKLKKGSSRLSLDPSQ